VRAENITTKVTEHRELQQTN